MCNLYSITTNQAAILALFRVVNRYVGNLPPMPGVFPDYPAPVVRNAGAERDLTMMRWGMPPPPRARSACATDHASRRDAGGFRSTDRQEHQPDGPRAAYTRATLRVPLS